MSKAQKGNKENKKPKADKNRSKNVSAYKAAQSLGKPASSRFGKKTWRRAYPKKAVNGRSSRIDLRSFLSCWARYDHGALSACRA
jgi:hypothetical protein